MSKTVCFAWIAGSLPLLAIGFLCWLAASVIGQRPHYKVLLVGIGVAFVFAAYFMITIPLSARRRQVWRRQVWEAGLAAHDRVTIPNYERPQLTINN
jgi:hypothetical protein